MAVTKAKNYCLLQEPADSAQSQKYVDAADQDLEDLQGMQAAGDEQYLGSLQGGLEVKVCGNPLGKRRA